MPEAPDFAVDPVALTDAATALTGVLHEVSEREVKNLDCRTAAFGHPRLAATVHDFCDRWQLGIEHLTADGAQLAKLLDQAGQTYEQADAEVTGAVQEIAAALEGPSEPGAPGREVV